MSQIKRKTSGLLAVILICAALLSPAEAQTRPVLVPLGSTVGITMSTDGALVVGLSSTGGGSSPSPAAVAGILPGDLITAVDGKKIGSASELRAEVAKLGDKPLTVSVQRGSESMEMSLCPNLEKGGAELGLWLRDSVAGIGTLTFYDPQSGQYGGLGHGINDIDSGVLMPLGAGSIMSAEITDVKKGAAGTPGELRGVFDPGCVKGGIDQNTSCGIFGILSGTAPEGQAIPIAFADEIQLGEAVILSNISGTEIKEYEIEITRVYHGDETGRSMMLSVKDETLLRCTGGIVQGMSGSPILQNGRLIGAVTHVLVNDPTRGFGISIESMLSASNSPKDKAA